MGARLAPESDRRTLAEPIEQHRSADSGILSAATRLPIPITRVLGVPIAHLDEKSAIEEIVRLTIDEPPAHVVHVNVHTLNLAHQSAAYHAVLRRANLVLRDGVGVGLAAWLQGRPFPANLNGTDFTPRVLRLAAAQQWTVYLLGGLPGVAAAAAERLERSISGLMITGVMHGYFPPHTTPSVIRQIRESNADVLLVAMGNPLQELWLDRYLVGTQARLGVGVGAFLDFVAGRVARAPRWVRQVRLEWGFRLLQEPRRLAHRYLVGNPRFIQRVLQEHFAQAGTLPESLES